jgi:hypothetical protein
VQQHTNSKSPPRSMTTSHTGTNTTHHTSESLQHNVTITVKLTDLPNELLLHIARYLRVVNMPDMIKEERFDGKERITFVRGTESLINLSRACRKLRPIAQEALLHTVVLGGFDGLPAIVSLVRLLLNRPDMRKHVRQLRIGLPPNEIIYLASKKGWWLSKPLGSPPSDIWLPAAELIASSQLPTTMKHAWQEELSANYPRPLCGVLLAMVQNLEYLSISHSLGRTSGNAMLREMFGIREGDNDVDLSVLPAFMKLQYFNNDTILDLRPTLILPAVSPPEKSI